MNWTSVTQPLDHHLQGLVTIARRNDFHRMGEQCTVGATVNEIATSVRFQ